MQQDLIDIGLLMMVAAGLWFTVFVLVYLSEHRGLIASVRGALPVGLGMAVLVGVVIAVGAVLYQSGTAIDSFLSH